MQRLGAILLIFILLMSMAPCADALDSNFCESGELCETSSAEHDTNEADDCLPFCSCTCCTALITVPFQSFDFQEATVAIDDAKLENLTYTPPAFDIWQPPKI